MLVGRMRPQGERVYFALHQFPEGGIYHTVARHRVFAGKLRRYDVYHIVPASFPRTGMSGVLVAFVDDVERDGFEHGEAGFHRGDARIHCGKVFLNGRTLISAYTPADM